MKLIVKRRTGDCTEEQIDIEHACVFVETEDGERYRLEEYDGRIRVTDYTSWHGHIDVQPHMDNVLSFGHRPDHEFRDESVHEAQARFAEAGS